MNLIRTIGVTVYCYEINFIVTSKSTALEKPLIVMDQLWHLVSYPPELIPFESLDSADNRYGQLHNRIGKSPYKEAGIEGFTPLRPFQIASHYLTKGDYRDFHFPTLAELNKENSPFPWIDNNERIQVMSCDTIEDQPTVLYTGAPPSRAV